VSGNGIAGLLQQRCIEAKIFKAFLTALEREFGAEKARSLAASVVRDLAFQKGREFRNLHPKGDIGALANLWRSFSEGGALDIEFIEQTEGCLSFRIKRCGYADAYREMGLADIGCLLSCDRDEPFLKGFSDKITLNRSRTIMEGGSYCSLVYCVKK
jgi:hypothetical protein